MKKRIITVMAASVWMYCISLPRKPSSLLPRSADETTPTVTEFDSDRGEPKAATNSPGRTSLEFPSLRGVSPFWGKKSKRM